MPKDNSIKKVLVIGSGPIVIGQAAEFDYAGTQACRVLKSEGINVVLLNSNPATIMTDKHLADEIYLESLTLETVERILAKERPDGILAGLGGQTGLTLAMQLEKAGIPEKYGCRILGTDAAAINKAEDRELFRETMESIDQPCVPSGIANTLAEALDVADKLGYPVIIRPAFTLGGTGGGIAANKQELEIIAKSGLELSPITQVLVEKCISGWKEIEFETMRDATGEAVIVCSMENVDPVGIHTGDSIVAAPALTLTDREFSMLRQASLDIVAAIGVIGGCNCQFALKPDGSEYAVIEVNPRVSRSSALASKATGYPIARITAMLALGYTLDEIRNPKTGASLKGFEPQVDYLVLKFPKWPFDKFYGMSRKLGTQMKATGEVMAIADTLEGAFMKAVRGLEIGQDTFNMAPYDERPVTERLADQDDRRLFTVFEAIKAGVSAETIYEITKIDWYFLEKLKNLADFEQKLAQAGEAAADGILPSALYREGKNLCYTDKALEKLSGLKVKPEGSMIYKAVRTCEAVFGTEHPYYYSVYSESADAAGCESRGFPRSGKPVICVLGSGPIRIGQGIEFDYSSVHCVWALSALGYDVIIINNNPETVSTDFDTADRLYFEPLTTEDVLNILAAEKPEGVVVAFGGQTAIKLAAPLDKAGVKILGTSAEGIDLAEDREKFDKLLERFGIRRPAGALAMTLDEAVEGAAKLGYPVLLRPSYVIGGQNMTIAKCEADTRAYMGKILAGGIENPVLVDKYMPGIELEVDVISDGENVLIPGIMEHIERAGVHSGDSIAVYPPYNLTDNFLKKICDCSEKLGLALGTKGLVNIQYLIHGGELYVIEVNPRASRTVPYISKVTGVPMTDLAADVMLGGKLTELGWGTGLARTVPYCAVKVPVFSFEKLNDANSILGPEMKSTGEVLGIGKNLGEALCKGLASANLSLPAHPSGVGVLISVEESSYGEIVPAARTFSDAGMVLYATPGTAEHLGKAGISAKCVGGSGNDEIISLMEQGAIGYIIYTGAVKDGTLGDYIRLHKRAMQLGIPCLTSVDTAGALADASRSRYTQANVELVDICHLRRRKQRIPFTKMQTCGNDYIFIENFDNKLTCPESLCVDLCSPHYGIGADGIVLIEDSDVADVKMRSFNKDGSEGRMAGNNIRCVAKLLYDEGLISTERMTVETASGVHSLKLMLRDGKVNSVSVDMGIAAIDTSVTELTLPGSGEQFSVTLVDTGNPHCVIFSDSPETLDIGRIGPAIEHHELFPGRTNVEFVRVTDRTEIRVKVWERGNGETLASGTSAAAACAACVAKGLVDTGRDIKVKLPGGDVSVRVEADGQVTLTGSAVLVFKGEFQF